MLGSNSLPPPPDTRYGIGFVNSSESSCFEAKEEALYLSRALGGVLVRGVHHSKCCGFKINHAVLNLLLETWDRFFLVQPQSKFIQYFFGDGSYLVASALQITAHQDKIIVVGINPSTYPSSFSSYYYRYPRSCFLGKKDAARVVSRHPFSGGYYRVTFQDPAFTTPIQYAYYNEVGFEEEKTDEQFHTISVEVASILERHSQVLTNNGTSILQTEEVATQAQLLMRASRLEWSSREFWGASRLGWLLRAYIAALRVMDHIACQFLPIPSACVEKSKADKYVHVSVHENKTFIEELYRNATEGRFPFCIYPCGINATGYSEYGRVVYDDSRIEYSYYIDGKHLGQNKRTVLPCGISGTGRFPTGEFPYGKVKQTELFYRFFFNGSLTMEKIGANLPKYREQRIVGNITSVPQMYPSNITLNGQFINCSVDYPYGIFSNGTFSYKDFFSNDFDHNNKFIKHLNDTLVQLNHTTGEPQDLDAPLRDTNAYSFLLDPFLSVYWTTYGIVQLLLISPVSSRMKSFALAIVSTGSVMDVTDLIANLIATKQNHYEVNLRMILCAYAMTSLFVEALPYLPPLLRESAFCLGISSTQKLVTRKFRRYMYNVRVVFMWLLMLLNGSFFLAHYVTNEGNVVLSSIHGLFALVVLPLMAFLFFKYPA